MRRADRLFRIIQILRRKKRPVTAEQLADELGTSKRSIYRDIAELMNQRVPIRGEAGLGYVLGRDFDMPPLMLTSDELEAAVLGAQWVADRGDRLLAGAARDLLAKLSAAVPEHLRTFISLPAVGAPMPLSVAADGIDLVQARQWIRAGKKIRISYRDEKSKASSRTVWPVMIGYAESVRLLAAWCELRDGFRHFRTERITSADFLDEPIGCAPRELHARWREMMVSKRRLPPE